MKIFRLSLILLISFVSFPVSFAYTCENNLYDVKALKTDERADALLHKEIKLLDEHKLILDRLNQLTIANNNGNKNGEFFLSNIGDDGRWEDVNYRDEGLAVWNPINHLERIKAIAICYNDSTSNIYHSDKAVKSIDEGLQTWIELNPICKNWWYNDIAVPKILVAILSLVGDDITLKTKRTSLALLETRPLRKIASEFMAHTYYAQIIRGCLLGNDSVVQEAADKFFEPLGIGAAEDIQKDMSYLKHGPQFHNGSYGGEFIERYVDMSWLLNGTKFQPDQEKMTTLCRFFRDGYMPLFRCGYIDYSSAGRAISRKNYLKRSKSLEYISRLMEIDTLHKNTYAEFYANIDKPGNQTKNYDFSSAGFMLHRRPSFDFSVRCVSQNLRHTESINGENLYGTYLSDGAVNIRVDGDEYYNIFPVWEWDYVPGTTTAKGEISNNHCSNDLGDNCQAGGVSDGNNGIMCYMMNDYGIKAKKAWFMIDDIVVCLGNSITGTGDIHTSANQCLLEGDVYINGIRDKEHVAIDGNFSGWIWHDKIGYYFPKSQNIRLKSGMQTGSWNKINSSQPDEIIDMYVLNLSIEHGVNPQNASYEYYILPGTESKNYLENFDISSIDIIANDQNISAVYDSNSDVLGIVFWRPGSLDYNGVSIVKDTPCIVMISDYKGSKCRLLEKKF